ncbi:hypothetical protein ABFA07_000870 [Porites harrisoni]
MNYQETFPSKPHTDKCF